MSIGFTIFTAFFLIAVLMLVVMGVKSVPQGWVYTVERFGKYTKILEPGLNFIVPFFDTISKKLDIREQVVDVPAQEVITQDNARVEVDGVVFYQVLDAKKATYEISNLAQAIMDLVTTNIRVAVGSMELNDLLSKREEISTALLHDVDDATERWGIKIMRVKIKDITPPQDLLDTMAKQLKAEREKRAAILTAEGDRQAAINRAEGQRQAAILEAEGQKSSTILRAEGEHEATVMRADAEKEASFRQAEARERLAEAEAKATMMMSNAINRGNLHAINYFVAEKYLNAVQHLASGENNKLIFMPLELTSLASAIGGIGELAKGALNNGQNRNGGDGPTPPQGGPLQ